MDRSVLDAAHAAAVRYLDGLGERPVGARADAAGMRAALSGPLPEKGEPAAFVVEELARKADPGLVATAGPRFFGFVIGGSLPAAVGADWLTSAWDQNAGLFVLSPAAAVVEETVADWLKGLFGLPPGATPEEGDGWTREVIARVQREGTCWPSGTVWRERALMRISACNWSTTTDDVRRSAAAILAAHEVSRP